MTRKEFESLMREAHGRSVTRWSDTREYKDSAVQLAWEVLQGAQRRRKEEKL